MSSDSLTEKIMQNRMECQREIKQERHEFRGEMQSLVSSVDSRVDKNTEDINKIENTLNLFEQASNTMNKNIEEIKVLMTKGFEKIENNFVTKTEIGPYKRGTGLLVAGLIGAFAQKLSSLIF